VEPNVAVPPLSEAERTDRNWASAAHFLTLLGYLVVFGHVIPPLVVLLAKGDRSAFVADQAKESLNFQITVFLATVVTLPFVCLLVGIPVLVLIVVLHLVLVIVGSIRASDGERYRYPLCLRIVR
jgi:uncharacterized protein